MAGREGRARGSLERGTWGAVFDDLSAADRQRQLEPDDLERLAVAAYMVGSDEACERAWLAAHHAWLARGEATRAARCAFWQALGLFFRGELAPATGWVARGGRLLPESGGEPGTRSPVRACSPPASRSCSRPATWKQRGQRPTSSPTSQRSSTPRT